MKHRVGQEPLALGPAVGVCSAGPLPVGSLRTVKSDRLLVGIDTGGTFTDLVAIVGGELRTHKVLSTPKDPAAAVLQGLRELLPDHRSQVVIYASTVATNALLQRRGARVVLLTTAGFEDVIEIGRQNRPRLYDLEPRPPEPLVPRHLRLGVPERMLHDGQVLVPLSAAAVRRALAAVRRHQPAAVAVCLLHSYANAAHERLLGAVLAKQLEVFPSLSHELVTEYREYERASTTVINAYVGPIMSRHLERLDKGVRHAGGAGHLRIMQSNGGTISARRASREAVRTVLSGPAAGVIGAWAVARTLGLRRVITFDMGGTSTDVSLIDGAVRYRSEWTIGGLPLKIPAIDIHTVGAGGGSIARRDAGGALKVGPESAGADPGPACYGSGTEATVTDANVLLGRLVAAAFLGGRMPLDTERARTAISRLGRQLKLEAAPTAAGIVRVVNAGMERAIRSISVERGHDPREYTLIAFGGAAGQHACELSMALGIREVIVPRDPGLLSAWGAAHADVKRDYVRTVRVTNPSAAQLYALCAPLERSARTELREEGVVPARQALIKTVDVRYQGQSHEISLPLGERIAAAFHNAHRRLYGYADTSRPIEVVNVRLLAIGRTVRHRRLPFVPAAAQPARRHRVHWNGRWRAAPHYARAHLRVGAVVRGPALIAEFSATTFVAPGWRALVDPSGHLRLTYAR